MRISMIGVAVYTLAVFGAYAENTLQPLDVFQMEFASDPQIAPDGKRIVYVRNFMDIMKDRQRSNLWIVDADGSDHRPLTTGNQNHHSPRWSPDGKKMLYASSEDGSSQLYVRWMDTGQTAKITNLTDGPGGLAWSPDGQWIAFSMLVPAKPEPLAKMPPKPEGAEWAAPAKVIQKLVYRADGAGYLKDGYRHLFVVPSEGGSARQITSGDFNHGATPSWSADSASLIFSANRHDDWEYDPVNSEVYEVSIADGGIKPLTDRQGPDSSPVVSPNGKRIAYVGYDDQLKGYQLSRLYVMDRDGANSRLVSQGFDRSIGGVEWAGDGNGVYFEYSDKGNGKIGYMSLRGKARVLASDVGGTALGRPYGGGSYTIANNGRIAYTQTRPEYPSDIAVVRGANAKRVTRLNDDVFGHTTLAKVEEVWYKSSFDGRDIQGWIMTPPDFDPAKKYPLILEIHGGPFSDYGDRFSAECQLYASAGYVVLYTNPRGSTSYGEEFGNLIHHNYPGEDYDDLMSGVDAVIARGYIDTEQLFVTGGSGGGVLSAWIVGKTDRFAAAVVAKPVINWYSFVLTSDSYNFFYKYWFPGPPWEHQDHYMKRSPLSLVGNVTTPTMLLTGERDYRTPISESEQFYQALQLRKVESALVRIPDASHSITARPSNLIAKVAHVLAWFEKYRGKNGE